MKDELYKALIEDSLMGYASYKIIRNRNDEPCDFAFIEANTACKEIFGWKGRKIVGKRISALYPSNKNQGNRYPEFYNNVDVQGVGKEYEYYAVPLQKWYRVHTIMLDPDHFAALFIDVSEQKKTQAEIIEEKDYFQRMFNTNPDASLVSRLSDGIILDVNDGFVTNMGYSREEILGKGTLEMHLYENPALRGRILNEIAQKGYCSNVETSFRRKDGKIITGILSAKKSTLHGDECIISNTREITDLMQAEAARIKSEERFRLLFDTMAQGVVFQEEDGTIISANPAAERILGLTMDQMQGRTSMDTSWKCLHEDGSDWPGEEHPAMIALRTGKQVGPIVMGIFQPKINAHVWNIINATPLFREGEKTPYQAYTTMQDITAERAAHQDYRLLFNEMQDAFALHEIICDDQGKPIDYRFLAVNPAFEQMTGLVAKNILGKTVREVLPETESFWIESCGRVALTGEPIKFVNYSAVLDKYFSVSAYQSAPRQFAITFVDVTANKQAEEQLRQSEERFQLLFEEAPLGYQALNATGCFIEVNQTWLDTFGHDREDVIGKWFGDFLTPEYVEGFREQFLLFKVRGHMQSEFKMIHKTGKELIISFEGRIANDVRGKFKQAHCILRDVTDLRSTEKALAHSHELMRYVIEHNRSGIAIFDREMNYLYVSQRYLDDFKVHEKDIIGKNHYRVFPNLTRGLREVHQRALAGEIVRAEDDPYKRKDGTTDWTRWECRPWYEADASIGGIIIYSEIITERKQAEEKLLYQSNHDYLTGLYNRRFFEEELKRLDTKRNFPMTLVMGDVNGLKLINDSFGHALGDELLIKTAEVMKSVCRADDIIARLGGDEFAIILPKTDAVMAENIVERLNDRATIEKIGSINLSICFGHESKIVEEDDIQGVLTKAENHLYRNKLYKSSSMRSKTVDIVMKTLFEKSGREMAHSNRVSEICGDIAHHVPLDSESVSQIKTAGLMHDIGKIGIDENILNKPNRLSDEEWTEMKRHPEVGWRILSSVDEFSELAQFILEHHERWDGKGYPKGITGTDISIEGRIIAIADSFDAMTSFRTYRKSLSEEEAIMEIKRCAGTQFDPEVAKIFVEKVMRKTW